jgi:4-hydroxy-tetrahydrodipicolinate synthase
MNRFEGIITALITPFKNGDVDLSSLKKLIRYQLDQGVDGFVVHGTTAESPTTTEHEKEKIFQFVKSEVSGQVPLIAGTGTNSTADSVEKSKKAQSWGADAILTVVPYYNKPPQRGLVEHFNKIANAVTIPTILYNVPSRTVTALEADTVTELSQNSKIIGIKEATGNMELGEQIIKSCPQSFIVLSGDDKTFLDLSHRGGRGVIGVVSHVIADKMKKFYQKIKSGEASALKSYEKYFPLIDSIYFEANPIPIKYVLQKLGVIESAELRLPLTTLKKELHKKIDKALKDAGL